MYAAVDIANYVVNYVKDHGEHISNLKLQKILYYIQAAFLCEKGKGCFSDPIMCWRHGPVVQSVYNKFSSYGGEEIPRQIQSDRLVFKDGRLQIEKCDVKQIAIKPNDRNLIDQVVDGLMPYGAWYLVDRTHEEDPWLELENYNEEITPLSIKRYFEKHKERLYGRFD